LITGASRGLGLALARGLARRGWQLIIDARGREALNEAHAELSKLTTVIAVAGDVTDKAHRRALAVAARSLGGLDALVNNAGILGPSPQPALLDYPLDVLEGVYRANVVAPLGVVQALHAGQALKPGVRIVNISSDAGAAAYPGWGGYGSSKAALEQLSAILAAENPAWRVYWVDPGDMRTQMHQEAYPGEDISDRPLPDVSVPGLVELLEGDVPSGRYVARTVGAAQTSWTAQDSQTAQAVQELRVVLTADDYEQTLHLYRDGFGLKTVDEWNTPEGRGMVLAAGKATLEVLDRSEADRVEHIEADGQAADRIRLAFNVADVKAATASLQLHGAHALGGLAHTPWGHFNQRLLDHDGTRITLFQTLSEAEAHA
jgi:NAD(P)-dependent dehydrogenase (short-subunit alcohol dehydrogenase family)